MKVLTEEKRLIRNQKARDRRKANPERARAAERKYKDSHRSESRNYAKIYRITHPNYQKRYYLEHRDTYKARDKKWRSKNPDKAREIYRRYERRHPEIRQLKESRRRALELNAPGLYTVKQWKDKVAYHGYKCFYCKIILTYTKKQSNTVTQEHRIPLSRGGSNWPANLVPACLRCNLKKNKKKPNEFSLAA